MTFRDRLAARADKIRGIPHKRFDIRPWRVYLRTKVWSGDRVGVGTVTTTTAELLLSNGGRPKVREVRSADVVASGGTFTSAVYEVGPMTPGFGRSGIVDPATSSSATEVLFLVTGDGLPSGGVLCKRIDDDSMKPFSLTFRIERLGR